MKNIRATKLYKTMDSYTAVGLVEGFVEASSEDEIITALQKLHDTRQAYQLQGFFGRACQSAIEQGIIAA